MATLNDPWFVEDQVFLRADRPQHAVRLPSPPTLMSQDGGPPAAQLTLFRYPDPPGDDFPGGGAVLSLAIDFGAPAPGIDARELELPVEVREIGDPIHAPGTVGLYFGGAQLARAPVPAGFRPVVALAATLDPTQAVLLRETMQQGILGPLYAVAEGAIVVRRDGPEAAVEIDLGRAKRALPADRELPAAEAAAALHALVEDGTLRLETTAESLSEPARLLCLAAAAERLFEPVVTTEPWVLVPGWPSCPPAAALRLRGDLDDRALRVRVGRDDETTLPWFAAAPIGLPVGALQEWELPRSRVWSVQVMLNGAADGDLAFELEVEPGQVHSVRLAADDQMRTLRFLPPDGWDRRYRWRAVVSRPDGGTAASDWVADDSMIVVVTPSNLELSPASPADASHASPADGPSAR